MANTLKSLIAPLIVFLFVSLVIYAFYMVATTDSPEEAAEKNTTIIIEQNKTIIRNQEVIIDKLDHIDSHYQGGNTDTSTPVPA